MKHRELDRDRLRQVLSYDPKTGVFTWARSSSRSIAGNVAGVGCHGYVKIWIDDRRYYAHRLAWLYVTGEWPTGMIDHINGSKNDNRFSNLRQATPSQNLGNSKRQKRNTSGFKGVSRSRGGWQVCISADGKRRFLGRFDTLADAHAAYVLAAEKLYGEFARCK